MMEKVETDTRLTVEEFLEMAERPEYAGQHLELSRRGLHDGAF